MLATFGLWLPSSWRRLMEGSTLPPIKYQAMRSTSLARLACLLLLVASPFLLYPDLPGSRAVAEEERPSSTFSGPLDFSDTALASLEPTQIERLWRHLRSSAAWRVTREDGAWVATRRKVTGLLGEGREEPLPGSLRSGEGEVFPDLADSHLSVKLRQGSRPSVEAAREVDRVQAGGSVRSLRIMDDPPWVPTSEVVISGAGGLQLEISEQSEDAAREATQRALDQVNREVRLVLQGLDEIHKHGYLRGLLPAESTAAIDRHATLRLEEGYDSGLYEVVGHVASGEPGAVYIKAFDLREGTPLSAETVQERTLEHVGWSPIPGLAFFYNGELQIYEGGRDDQYLARFELWFVPQSGAPERMLAHATRSISGWER